MAARKTERLGSPKVQDHLELGRELHRKIARLIAAQDAIDISGGAAKAVYHAVSVGEPASPRALTTIQTGGASDQGDG